MPDPQSIRMYLLSAFLSLFFVVPMSAQSYTLEEAVAYGLENRNELQNAEFDTYIAEQQVREILSSGYPQLNGQVTAQWNYQIQQFPFPNPATGETELLELGTGTSLGIGASLNQLVFDGTFFIGLKAAKAFVDVSKTKRASTAEQLRYNITSAYYQSLIAERQISLLETNLDRLKTLYDETSALYKEGFVEKLDVERLQVNYNNLLLDLKNLERRVQLSKNLLKFQMGLPVNSELELATQIDELGDQPSLEDSEDNFTYSNRLDYSLVRQQIDLEEFNTRRFRAGYLPSLYLFGNYNWNQIGGRNAPENKSFRNFTVGALGLQLNMPIFDGFRKSSQIQQSKLTIQKLDNQKLRLESAIDLELENTRSELLNTYATLGALKKNSELAQKVYDVSRIKYKEGVGSSLEVNDASTQLKTAQTNYLNGLLQYYVAKIGYDKARGRFTE
ncbi:MAG: TolC family protein [Bacteroidia bacterium]